MDFSSVYEIRLRNLKALLKVLDVGVTKFAEITGKSQPYWSARIPKNCRPSASIGFVQAREIEKYFNLPENVLDHDFAASNRIQELIAEDGLLKRVVIERLQN